MGIGSLSHSNQTRERNARNPNWIGRSKTHYLQIDIILNVEYPNEATEKLLGITNVLSKFGGYKINTEIFYISIH